MCEPRAAPRRHTPGKPGSPGYGGTRSVGAGTRPRRVITPSFVEWPPALAPLAFVDGRAIRLARTKSRLVIATASGFAGQSGPTRRESAARGGCQGAAPYPPGLTARRPAKLPQLARPFTRKRQRQNTEKTNRLKILKPARHPAEEAYPHIFEQRRPCGPGDAKAGDADGATGPHPPPRRRDQALDSALRKARQTATG